MPLVRTIAVLNQKGGVGKTTTVANLGAAVAARGRSICLIDLDPQAHLTLHFGLDADTMAANTYQVLTRAARVDDAAILVAENLWVLPAVIDLAGAQIELAAVAARELVLRDRMADAHLPCELVLIDCPPSLGLLTINALAAADEVFIPLQPHFLALQGLGKLLETVALVQRQINPTLKVSGIILAMYERGTRLAAEVVADIEEFIAAARGSGMPWADVRLFQTVIRRNIKLAECPSHGTTIFEYAPASRGARDYNALADELVAWLDGRPWQRDDDVLTFASPHEPPAQDNEAPVELIEPPVAPDEPSVEPGPPPQVEPTAGQYVDDYTPGCIAAIIDYPPTDPCDSAPPQVVRPALPDDDPPAASDPP